MSSKAGSYQGQWQLKRVNSSTGPNVGTYMSDAIREPHSITGQTEILWKSSLETGETWFDTLIDNWHFVNKNI